jgi:hypothetical protein
VPYICRSEGYGRAYGDHDDQRKYVCCGLRRLFGNVSDTRYWQLLRMEDTQECVFVQVPKKFLSFIKFRVDSEQRKLVAYGTDYAAVSQPVRCVSRTEVRRILIISTVTRARIRYSLISSNPELPLLIITLFLILLLVTTTEMSAFSHLSNIALTSPTTGF